jgi:hypothetical protein
MGPLVQARLHDMLKASQGTNGVVTNTRASTKSVGLRNQELKIEMENIVASRKLPVKKRAEIVDSKGTLQLSEDAKHCSLSLVMRPPLAVSEDTTAESARGSDELVCTGPSLQYTITASSQI